MSAPSPEAHAGRSPSWVDAFKNELAAVVALAGAVGLAMGYALTWARVSYEGMPTEVILTTLPRSFYLQQGLAALAAPAALGVFTAVTWVPLMALRNWRSRDFVVFLWAVFGLLLAALSACVANWLNHGAVSPPEGRVDFACAVAFMLLSAALGYVLHEHVLPRRAGGNTWRRVRPILAATLSLCIIGPSSLQVLDASFTDQELPYAQAVTNAPCSAPVPNGRPAPPQDLTTKPDAVRRCLIGGFYLGASEHFFFFVQRENPCRRGVIPAQLVIIPRSSTEIGVVRSQYEPPGCPAATP